MEVFTNNWNSHKYQIGYALSGGFIKGFAHLGAVSYTHLTLPTNREV